MDIIWDLLYLIGPVVKLLIILLTAILIAKVVFRMSIKLPLKLGIFLAALHTAIFLGFFILINSSSGMPATILRWRLLFYFLGMPISLIFEQYCNSIKNPKLLVVFLGLVGPCQYFCIGYGIGWVCTGLRQLYKEFHFGSKDS